eukprot:jgi/Undpi1/5077/HiC_scaffold_19.g08429.m1
MGVFYNTTTDTDEGSRLTGSQCNRIVGAGASADDSAVEYNKLCAFKNSGPVELVYTEESESLNGTAYSATVDPRELQVVITNTGSTTASVQVVLFSSDYPAPNEDSSIDRVHTRSDQDENTYTVDASFQAEGSTDTFCDEGVCAVYAYYIKIDDEDSDADLLFGTTCQARTGVMVYEGFTTVSSLADDGDDDPEAETASHGGATSADETSSHGGATSADVVDAPAKTATSTTPYDLSACTEFPTHTEATYRVYLVVSPDTATASRVGYGLRDQLLFESEEIHVEDDMDHVCPEICRDLFSARVRDGLLTPVCWGGDGVSPTLVGEDEGDGGGTRGVGGKHMGVEFEWSCVVKINLVLGNTPMGKNRKPGKEGRKEGRKEGHQNISRPLVSAL